MYNNKFQCGVTLGLFLLIGTCCFWLGRSYESRKFVAILLKGCADIQVLDASYRELEQENRMLKAGILAEVGGRHVEF